MEAWKPDLPRIPGGLSRFSLARRICSVQSAINFSVPTAILRHRECVFLDQRVPVSYCSPRWLVTKWEGMAKAKGTRWRFSSPGHAFSWRDNACCSYLLLRDH